MHERLYEQAVWLAIALFPGFAPLVDTKTKGTPGHIATLDQFGQIAAMRGIGQIQIEAQAVAVLFLAQCGWSGVINRV